MHVLKIMVSTNRLLCIVDDAADYRFLLGQIFEIYFPTYPVSFFSSGQLFLGEISTMETLPGLIVLDRHMPELNGYETLIRLKQHPLYQTIPVIMMSSDASASEVANCYREGASSFLAKPTDFDDLKQTMSLVCNYWLELN